MRSNPLSGAALALTIGAGCVTPRTVMFGPKELRKIGSADVVELESTDRRTVRIDRKKPGLKLRTVGGKHYDLGYPARVTLRDELVEITPPEGPRVLISLDHVLGATITEREADPASTGAAVMLLVGVSVLAAVTIVSLSNFELLGRAESVDPTLTSPSPPRRGW
jgi:hypothetical protein